MRIIHHRGNGISVLLLAMIVAVLPVAGCAVSMAREHDADASAVVDEASASAPASADAVTLRETTNGSYSARLTFKPQELGYLVELFHQGNVWRVIRTDVVKTAETTFDAFAQQTRQLAQVEIDTLRLQAGKQYAEHMVVINTERMQALQANLSRQHQESRQVMSQQNAVRQQAQALSGDLRNVSAQLNDVQKNIRMLEAQQAAPELPVAPAAPAEASSSTSP